MPETVQGVLITAGGHGAAYCFRNNKGGLIKGFVPVLKVKVADTTGAGDAFLSGFLYSMVKVCLRTSATAISAALLRVAGHWMVLCLHCLLLLDCFVTLIARLFAFQMCPACSWLSRQNPCTLQYVALTAADVVVVKW